MSTRALSFFWRDDAEIEICVQYISYIQCTAAHASLVHSGI
jgi:hypothetical protein